MPQHMEPADARFWVIGRIEGDDDAASPARIEAWERDDARDTLITAVDAAPDGSYLMEFGQGTERRPDVFLRATRGGVMIATTEHDVRWDLRPGKTRIDLVVEQRPVITGRVVDDLHRPSAGVTVRANRLLPDGGVETLGSARTDADGRYAITYDADGPVDLEVRVRGRRDPVTRFGTSGPAVVDVALSDVEWAGPSALERLIADIDETGVATLDPTNVERVVAKTGADYFSLTMVADARRVAEAMAIPEAVSFAFLRSGLPADPDELVAVDPSEMRVAVDTAIEANFVPRTVLADADEALGQVRAHRVATMLDNRPDGAMATLREALTAGGVRGTKKQELLAGTIAEGGELDDASKLAVDLAELTGNNPDLIARVRRTRGVASLRDLAGLDADAWASLVEESGAPAPAGDVNAAAYAAVLAERVETAFPAHALLGRAVAEAKATDGAGTPLARFVAANPSFRLDGQPVAAYVRENKITDAPPAAVEALQSLQRLLPVAPKYDQAKSLMADGLDSALAITQLGEETFVARHASTMGGPERARTMYRAADERALGTLTLLVNLIDPSVIASIQLPPPAVDLPDWEELFGSADFCECQHCASVVGPAAYLIDILHFLQQRPAKGNRTAKDVLFARRPDLAELELTCDNTTIVLPYVDLVNEILEEAIASRKFALDPGLESDLSVGNLSTSVRDAFAAAASPLPDDAELHVFQPGAKWCIRHPGWRYGISTSPNDLPVIPTPQTTGTPREQQANPEHVNAKAYDALRTRVHPWLLPYDLWLDEVRAFLGNLGVERSVLMNDFGVAGQAPLAAERLGLAGGEREVLTGASGQPRNAWAGTGSAWVTRLRNVRRLLDRSGLRYEELAELLTMRWVNPGRVFRLESTDANDPHTCDTTKLAIPALTADGLDRIHRFVRLRQKLEWSARDVDHALSLLATGLDDDGLAVVAELERLRVRLGFDVSEVLTFFGSIDTHRYVDAHGNEQPSVFDQLFRSRTVARLAPGAADHFALDASGDELAQVAQLTTGPGDPEVVARGVEELRSAIAGAIGVTGTELSTLLDGPDAVVDNSTMTKDVLTQLRRHALGARALGLSVEDFLTLKRLIGIDPFMSAASKVAPQDIRRFRVYLDAVVAIEASGQTLAELDYLLQHRVVAHAPLGPQPVAIAQHLVALRETLRAIRDDTRPVADPVGEVLLRKCVSVGWSEAGAREIKDVLQGAFVYREPLAALAAGVVLPSAQPVRHVDGHLEFTGRMTSSQRTALRNLSSNNAFRNAVNALFTKARTHANAVLADFPSGAPLFAAADVASLLDTSQTPQERFEFVLARVDAHLWLTGGTQAVEELLAGALDLTVPAVSILLRDWAYDADDADARLLPGFVDLGFIDSPLAVGADAFPGLFGAFVRLAKIADLVRHWKLPAAQLAKLLANAGDLGWLDPRDLPLQAGGSGTSLLPWLRMTKALVWQAELPTNEPTVLDLLVRALHDEPTVAGGKAFILDGWAKATGWRIENLESLLGARDEAADHGLLGIGLPAVAGDPKPWADEETWLRVGRCLAVAAKTGATITACHAWAQPSVTQGDARNARQAARARHAPETWPDVVAPIADALRERRRQALVAELVARPPAPGIAEPDDLFPWFLIDVEMAPCMSTSRVKQAISSVQLFAQRCLLNLEPDVPMGNDPSWSQWRWMKTYRVWEAARKIFLWPENWVEPELRDDKSAPFRELEEALAQTDLDDEAAEDALLTYIERLEQIAQLDVVAIHEDRYDVKAPATREVHVVARTRGTPAVYFYRKLVDSKWTPWERVDADIEGDTVTMAVWNGRLHVFWPVITEFQPETSLKMPAANEYMTTPMKELHLQLAWTERKEGAWTPKRLTKHKMHPRYMHPWDRREIGLSTITDAVGDLIVTVNWYWQHAFGTTHVQRFRLSAATGSGEVIDGSTGRAIDGTLATLGTGDTFTFGLPAGVEIDNMAYHQTTAAKLAMKGPSGASTDVFTSIPGPAPFRVRAHYTPYYTVIRPLVYADGRRSFFMELKRLLEGSKIVDRLVASPFHHPRVREFARVLRRSGLDGLYERSVQTTGARDVTPDYKPGSVVRQPLPPDDVDFSYTGAYAGYNWELFFHAPLLIADRLRVNQRFEEAQRWLHRIFDPTDRSSEPSPQRFWRTRPFFEVTTEQRAAERKAGTLTGSVLTEQVRVWRSDPFNPHAVARMRHTAYQRTTVMKYLDNLIGWGDQLFRRDTIESINEATQLYVLASEILGRRPETVIPRARPVPQSYVSIAAKLDAFSNALVAAESLVPPLDPPDPNLPSVPPITLPAMRYFCVPRNERLLGYWDTVADRLSKIRRCMNIEGVERQLALFEPPIDPAALVRAAAAGVDIGAAVSDAAAPLPPYRFFPLSQKATELCNDVQILGNALLTALEKRDGEMLAALRSDQELAVLEAVRDVRQRQIDEAKRNIDAIEASAALADIRREYYAGQQFVNLGEALHLAMSGAAHLLQATSAGVDATAAAVALIPNVKVAAPTSIGATYGGENVSSALRALAGFLSATGGLLRDAGGMALTVASYQRRAEEWQHQTRSAEQELEQLARQRAAAEVRLAIAERELTNHDLQIEHANKTKEVMESKFTNRQLYDWMVGQVSGLYFRSFQLAFDMAKRAERAYRYELGLQDSNFIRFGSWDSLRKGLLAGDRLVHELKRMEVSWLDEHRRHFELTKTVSLAMLDPVALLRLRETGSCFVTLPEGLFDLDHPGHYLRRLKSVSLTVPAVAGPYTNVNATLTLLASRVRTSASAGGAYLWTGVDDPRFAEMTTAVQSIATSHGQRDAGVFTVDFNDQRYLPFEGQGAVSEWRLELDPDTNRFDLRTVTDVLIHLSYTARDGGGALRQKAKAQLPRTEVELVEVRREMASEWARFVGSPDAAAYDELVIDLARLAPFRPGGTASKVARVDVYARLVPKGTATSVPELPLELRTGSTDLLQNTPLRFVPALGLSAASTVPASPRVPGEWVLRIAGAAVPAELRRTVRVGTVDHHHLDEAAVPDLYLAVTFVPA